MKKEQRQPYRSCEYLSNVHAPVELMGTSTLLNSTAQFNSAQRLMMAASHIAQAQIIHGC